MKYDKDNILDKNDKLIKLNQDHEFDSVSIYLKRLREENEQLKREVEYAKQESTDMHNALMNRSAELTTLKTAAMGLRKALSFYANQMHFEWCGKDDFEPENTSGEPINWESGGNEYSQFNLENGGIARQALAEYHRLTKGE